MANNIILRTKLYRPPVPRGHVHRPHLIELLQKNRSLPLTLVTAPAGYGKSTLVSCWMERYDTPSAWLSLDENDNDLQLFLTYFMAALHTIFPDAASNTMALVNSPNLPPLSTLISVLSNELDGVEHDFLLVLDDIHWIHEKSVHDFLDLLLNHPPRPMHLVLIGRRDPFLSISAFRARSQLSEIRLQNLRFTASETAAYLQQVFETSIEDDLALAWTEKTEGWIVGLRLAALAIQHQGDIKNLLPEPQAGAHYVRGYLFNEILSQQPAPIQDYLLKTSILNRFCAPLCETVTGMEPGSEPAAMDGWQFITRVKDDNLFLIKLDYENRWFRYHHMFQQLLCNQLKRRQNPEEIAALHHRASRWFEQQGLVDDAIQHALSAGDMMRAAQLVKQNRHAMYNDDKWFVVEKWLSLIPRRMIRQSPELLLAQTWVYYYHSDFAHIPPTLDAAEALLRKNSQDQPLQGEIDIFRGVFCFMQGRGERSLSHVEAALGRIQEEHQMVRGFAEMYFGLAGQMNGQLERVVPFLSRLIDDPLLAFSRRMRSQTVLVWLYLIAGNLNAASLMNTQLWKMANEKKSAIFATWSSYHQGLIHFWRNELDAARRQFHRAAESRYLVLRRASVDCLAGLALTCQAVRQTDKANEAVKQLSEYTLPFDDYAVNKILDSCKARLALMRGESASAASMPDVVEQPTDVGAMAIWLEVPEITRCRMLLADGSDASLQEAEKKLKAYGELNRGHHNTLHLIEVQVLLALVRHRQGRLEESLTVLEQAITMSEPGGIIRPFVEGGAPMTVLLGMLRQKKIAVNYVEKLLATLANGESTVPEPLPHPVAEPDSPQPLIEPLTNRELDILGLLAKRLQNKEIAQELCIAPTTVKTHLRNIYQKLSAKGRRHAIERAIALGLLSHR